MNFLTFERPSTRFALVVLVTAGGSVLVLNNARSPRETDPAGIPESGERVASVPPSGEEREITGARHTVFPEATPRRSSPSGGPWENLTPVPTDPRIGLDPAFPPHAFPFPYAGSEPSPPPDRQRLLLPWLGADDEPFRAAGAGGLATQAEITALAEGLNQALIAIEQNLIVQVFGDSLPLVGDKLADAAMLGLGALHQVTGLKTALTSGLNTLTGSATYTKAQVEQAITTALGNATITFSGITLDASNPTDLKLSMNTSKTFAAVTTPLDGGLGMPGLGIETSGSAMTALSYTLNLSVGVDAQGFYFVTAAPTALNLGLHVTVPDLDVMADLSRLRFRLRDESASDGDSVPPTSFAGTFALRLLDPNSDGRLRLGELGGDLLDPTLTANAAINLNLESDLGSADFPAIAADLNLAWNFAAAPVSVGDTNASFGSRPTIAFRKVTLDAGSFFSKFARPVLERVREISEPVQPIIEAVKAPIPLLTSLNEITSTVPKSLLEMAVASGTITQAQADRFDILAKVVEISNSLPPDGTMMNVMIDLGDFDLGTADPRVPDFDIAGITPNRIRTALTAALQDETVRQFIEKINGFPKEALAGGGTSQGMTFPILEQPETAFGLLLGKDVDLFFMDNATQNLPLYEIDEFIRLVGPIGFRFKGMGDVRLDFDFGFDTKGLLDFADSGDTLDIFNGFYALVPRNADGDVISMAELNADMAASAALNAVLAEVGAGGKLTADAHGTLSDPNGDGRVHLDEFIDQFEMSPLCVLEADGSLSFSLQAYVTLGYDFLSRTIDYEFPVGTLFDFSHACEDTPDPVFARISAGDAKLHIGPEAAFRQTGIIADIAEAFVVTHTGGLPGSEQIRVAFTPNGAAGGFGALPYGPVSGVIRGSGGEANDIITLAEDVVTPAILSGNGGIDRLTGGQGNDILSGGDERDFLIGRAGDDTLLGEMGNDFLEGGPGADLLDGGPGIDAVSFAHSSRNVTLNLTTGVHTNDAAGDTFLAVEQFEGTAFDDTLIGASGTDLLFGLGGNDRLEGRDGDDGLEGGPGGDILIGGPGHDYTTYFFSPAGVDVNLLNLVSHGGDAEGDTLTGIEALIGSPFDDTLTGDGSDNDIDGIEGNDVIVGDGGNDRLIGGEGSNTISGGDGDDEISGGDFSSIDSGAGNDAISGSIVTFADAGPGDDRFVGAAKKAPGQRDTIRGGDGDDFIKLGRPIPLVNLNPLDTPYPRWENRDGVVRVVGVGGSDVDGGPGIDTLSFEGLESPSYDNRFDYRVYGVSVNLSNNTTNYSASETTITGIENVIGTDYNDSFVGDAGPNVFMPLRGGGYAGQFTSGPDYIDGGGGVDTLSIDFSLHDDPHALGIGSGGGSFGRISDGTPGARGDSYILTSIERFEITCASKDDKVYGPERGYDDILIGNDGDDFLGGNGGSDHLVGGTGNDTLAADGTFSVPARGIAGGHDVLAGGPGEDLLDDLALNNGNYLGLEAGAVLQLDGGLGFDRFAIDLSNQTVPVVWNDATPGDLVFANGTFVRNCEQLLRIATGTGDDAITFAPRTDNFALLGPGNDVVRPGLGFDTLDGGPDNDLLILDFSVDDQPDYGGAYVNSGYRRSRAVAPFDPIDEIRYFNFERYHVIGTSKDDALYGGGDNDILIGLGGNDTLTGYGGNDFLDGGPGDDTLRTLNNANLVFDSRIEAGPGNDKVYLELSGGPYLYGVGYGNDSVNLGEGDDLLVALWFDGSFGRNSDVVGQIQRYDGGPGYDIGSADFGKKTTPVDFVQGRDNMIEFPDGSYFRHFETVRYFNSGDGNDRFVFSPVRETQDLSLGGGNDIADMGLGIETVFGGPGEDTLVVDWSRGDDATVSGIYFNGYALVRNDTATNTAIDFIYGQEFEHLHFTGGSKGDELRATNGSDILKGMGGSDYLRTYDGDDLLLGCDPLHGRGAGEVDQLIGDGGADVFVLGDADGRFYDDGNPSTPGHDGYARIADFNPSQDRLRLYGGGYLLGPSPIAGVAGTALFHDSDGNGVLDPASDELIATLGTATLTAANTLDPATAPTAPDLALIGLAAVQAAVSAPGPNGRFTLTFCVLPTFPVGLLLEVQTSPALGAGAPWRTIASKRDTGAWNGPATTGVSAVSGGKVTVTLTDLARIADNARQFYRFKLSMD